MMINWQPMLEDGMVQLRPLLTTDHQSLYKVASNPVLWQHHPIGNGYTPEGFGKFFDEALDAGALVMVDQRTNGVIGCTRFYGHDKTAGTVVIGHTFISRDHWGSGLNQRVKKLMFDHAFQYAQRIIFYVVPENTRSQKALEKLGAVVTGKVAREYEGRELVCWVYEVSNFENKIFSAEPVNL